MTYTILTSHFCLFVIFFFFKQKTAYEMRISDWSSDVCSSDLAERLRAHRLGDHHAFLDLDALQEQVRADQRTEEGAEAVEGLAEGQAEMAAFLIAERRRERVGRDLQYGDAARENEQAGEHERIDGEVCGREHEDRKSTRLHSSH